MATVYLIRHGENDYVKKNRLAGRLPGVHLNETGHKQAQAVAEKFKGAPIKAIYSSPLERTMETAAPIAQALGLEVVSCEGLLEVDFGEWQDQKLKGLSRLKIWRTVQFFPSRMRFPKGESFVESQVRAVRAVEELVARHDSKDTIIGVSHSDVIKLVVAHYIGLPLDLFQRLTVSPGSINALQVDEHGSRLLALNYDLSFTISKP